MPKLPSKSGSWLTNNVAKRQHDAIHQAISTTCLNEQECYDALWSYLTWQYEIDFVCNPEKRDQIITHKNLTQALVELDTLIKPLPLFFGKIIYKMVDIKD